MRFQFGNRLGQHEQRYTHAKIEITQKLSLKQYSHEKEGLLGVQLSAPFICPQPPLSTHTVVGNIVPIRYGLNTKINSLGNFIFSCVKKENKS